MSMGNFVMLYVVGQQLLNSEKRLPISNTKIHCRLFLDKILDYCINHRLNT